MENKNKKIKKNEGDEFGLMFVNNKRVVNKETKEMFIDFGLSEEDNGLIKEFLESLSDDDLEYLCSDPKKFNIRCLKKMMNWALEKEHPEFAKKIKIARNNNLKIEIFYWITFFVFVILVPVIFIIFSYFIFGDKFSPLLTITALIVLYIIGIYFLNKKGLLKK